MLCMPFVFTVCSLSLLVATVRTEGGCVIDVTRGVSILCPVFLNTEHAPPADAAQSLGTLHYLLVICICIYIYIIVI